MNLTDIDTASADDLKRWLDDGGWLVPTDTERRRRFVRDIMTGVPAPSSHEVLYDIYGPFEPFDSTLPPPEPIDIDDIPF